MKFYISLGGGMNPPPQFVEVGLRRTNHVTPDTSTPDTSLQPRLAQNLARLQVQLAGVAALRVRAQRLPIIVQADAGEESLRIGFFREPDWLAVH